MDPPQVKIISIYRFPTNHISSLTKSSHAVLSHSRLRLCLLADQICFYVSLGGSSHVLRWRWLGRQWSQVTHHWLCGGPSPKCGPSLDGNGARSTARNVWARVFSSPTIWDLCIGHLSAMADHTTSHRSLPGASGFLWDAALLHHGDLGPTASNWSHGIFLDEHWLHCCTDDDFHQIRLLQQGWYCQGQAKLRKFNHFSNNHRWVLPMKTLFSGCSNMRNYLYRIALIRPEATPP